MADVFMKFGDDRHKKGSIKLNRFAKKMPKDLKKAFNTVGEILERQIAINLSGSSHSKSPGNSNPFPGVVSGNLRRSASHRPLKPFGVRVGTGGLASDYAAAQEFGTATIPARPYVKTAWDKQEDKIMELLFNKIRKPLK